MKRERSLSEIAGLLYSPTTDIPFGKVIQIGTSKSTIFERVIEQGYRAGIEAFKEQLETQEEVEIPTDHELTHMINQRCPRDLPPSEEPIWRAYFVVGYTCAHLAVASLE